MKIIFGPDADLEEQISHVWYVECLRNEECVDRIVTKLRDDHLQELLEFGHDNFKAVLKMCDDRRVLFRLIRKQITFDQFITRVICDSQGVVYYCKDDLLDKGLSPEYFENLE